MRTRRGGGGRSGVWTTGVTRRLAEQAGGGRGER